MGLPHIMASAELKCLDGSTLHDDGDVVQVGIIVARVQKPDCAHGCILDNFPRNTEQAKILEDALRQHRGTGITHVIDLEVPTGILESRAAARTVDRNTGLPAGPEEKSGEVAGQRACLDELESGVTLAIPSDVQQDAAVHLEMLARRPDDAPERFQGRLQRYVDNIGSLRHFYACQCNTSNITLDGAESKQKVLSQALHSMKASKGADMNGRLVLSPMRSDHCRELVPSQEHAGRDMCDVRSRFQYADQLLQQVWKILSSFSQEVRSRWHAERCEKPCGCKVVTTSYIGADPPTDEVRTLLAKCVNLLHISRSDLSKARARHSRKPRSALSEARARHSRKTQGDMLPWLSWLFVSCSTASSEIEQLQRQYESLERRVCDARNMLTTSMASTATKFDIVYCSVHAPDLPSRDSEL